MDRWSNPHVLYQALRRRDNRPRSVPAKRRAVGSDYTVAAAQAGRRLPAGAARCSPTPRAAAASQERGKAKHAVDHEEAGKLLWEYAQGLLPQASAQAVGAHVASCAECRGLLETCRGMLRELAEHGQAMFTPHPDSDAIVRLAEIELAGGSAPAPTPEEQEAAAHARACPTCRLELDYARAVLAETKPEDRAQRSIPATGRRAARRWPRFALPAAAVILLLLYPACLGLFELPRARRLADQHQNELTALRERESGLRGELAAAADGLALAGGWSGGAAFAYLTAPTRGASRALPAVTLPPGQPHLPILIDWQPAAEDAAAASQEISLALLRLPDGAGVWSHLAEIAQLRERTTGVLAIMVPAGLLPDGDYRLTIRAEPSGASGGAAGSGSAALLFNADFRIAR